MKNVFLTLICITFIGCSSQKQAFYLPRSYFAHDREVDCRAIILEKDNEFVVCGLNKGIFSNDIYNVRLIARGTYSIKKDTLELNPTYGEIDNNKYLITKVKNGDLSLSYVPEIIRFENGEKSDMVIIGPNSQLHPIEYKTFKNLNRKLKVE